MAFRVTNVVLFLSSMAGAKYMDCGPNVQLCGIITLESGFGKDYYNHSTPTVHGMWPEVDAYGTSKCIKPSASSSNPTRVYPCYNTGEDIAHQLSFQQHEWSKHGVCAGVKDVDDYFGQICSLSAPPLSMMAKVDRSKGIDAMADALTQAGIEVFQVDKVDFQLELSTCQNPTTGLWVLAPQSKFGQACGGSPTPPTPPTVAPPTPAVAKQCTGARGPPCASNSDCAGLPGCVRCARSGFCTNIPL